MPDGGVEEDSLFADPVGDVGASKPQDSRLLPVFPELIGLPSGCKPVRHPGIDVPLGMLHEAGKGEGRDYSVNERSAAPVQVMFGDQLANMPCGAVADASNVNEWRTGDNPVDAVVDRRN
jgi:hypothetical protein